MVSMGPFIPTAGTPLKKFQIQNSKPVCNSQQKIDLNLKMIAILRLMMPQARIPVVTALETLGGGEDIRKKALESGANSLMFNLTPAKYRPLYKIYGKKKIFGKNTAYSNTRRVIKCWRKECGGN